MGPEFPHKLLLHTYACQGGKWAPLEPVQQLGGARPAPPPVRLKSLKVLTYNVCFECHRKDIREQKLISLMFDADADFLCLQEVTPGFMKRLFQTRWVQEAYVASDGPRGRTVAQGKRGASLQYGCVILAKKHWRPSFTAWALPGRLCRHLITAQCCAMPERAVPGVVVGGHDLPEPEPGSATPCAAPAACLPSPAGDMLHEADRGTPSPPCRQPEVDPQDCLSLVIATSHLESGKGATKFREEQLVHIFGLLGLLSEDTTRSAAIFMGDFNFSDGWPEERLLSPAFRDVWLARHRAEDGLTMTSQGTYKDWRPDHILIRSPTPRGLPADPTEFLMEPESIRIIGKDPLPLQPHEAPSGLDRFLTPSDHFGLVASLSLQRGIPKVNEVEKGGGEQVGGPLAPGFPSAGSSMTVEGASGVPPGTWDSARGPSAFSGASKAGATPSASGDTLPPLIRRASEHHLDFPASALEGCEGGVHSPMPGTGVCDAGHPTTPLLGAMKGTCPPSAACLTPAVPVPVHTPVAKPQQYTLDGGLIDISPPERARRPLALTAEAQRLQGAGDGPCSSSLALQRLDDASGSGGRGVDLNSTQPELRSRFQLTNSAAPASRLELGTPTPEVPSHRLLGKLVSPPTTHRASARCLDAGRSRLRSTGQGFGRLGAQAVLHAGHTSLTPAMQGLQLSQSSRSSPGRCVAERAGSVERKAARNGDEPHDDDLDVSGDTELLQVDGDDLGHLALQQHPQVSPSRVCGMGKGAPESDFAWAPAPRSEQGEGADSMDVLGPLDGADLASRSLELPSSAQLETDLGLAVRTQGLDMGVAAASAPVSGHSVSSLYTPHFAVDGGTPASFSPAVTPVAKHEGAPFVRPQRHSASFRAEDSFQDLQQDSELASIPFVQHDSGASAHLPQRPSSARSTASFQSSLGGKRRGRSEARIDETSQQQFFLAPRTATLRPGPEMLRSGAQTPGARSQQAEVLSFDGSGQSLRRSKSQYALDGRERARTSTSVGMGGGFPDFHPADVSPELAHDFDASGASRPMVAAHDSSDPDVRRMSGSGALPKPVTRVTTLPNGLRVATEESYGQVACVTAFVAAGSMYEWPDSTGVCHLLEHTAFKSTANDSADAVWGKATEAGISLSAANSREVLSYRADCVRDSMPLALGLLADTLSCPLITDAEVQVAKQIVEFQHYQANDMPQQVVQELLHAAAFGSDSALGRPLMAPLEALPALTPQHLHDFRSKHFTPDRIVLAAAGVDHDAFVAEVSARFGGLQPGSHFASGAPSASAPSGSDGTGAGGLDGSFADPSRATASSTWPRPPQDYIGGLVSANMRQNNGQPLDFSHMVVAFPTVGWTDADVVPMCVLDTLLGGGSSFSAGGPGKGMYSRLYRQVLNSFAWVDAANAFTLQYDHHGLFGMYGSAAPRDMPLMLSVLADQLSNLRSRPVSETELSRARNQLTSSVMMNLEMKSIQCEDIGRQVLILDKRVEPTDLVRRIQAVTAADLQRVATEALSKPPSVALLGECHGMPDYDGIRALLAEGKSRSYMDIMDRFMQRGS